MALPAYMGDLATRAAKSLRLTWSGHLKRAEPRGYRTPAALDSDVHVTLGRQWALQQPASRRSQGTVLQLVAAADVSMDWKDSLMPGPLGVRLLVMTLLYWGACIEPTATSEMATWARLASDFVDVLDVLARKGGQYKAEPSDDTMDTKRKRCGHQCYLVV